MWEVRCPYCRGTHGRCATTAAGRSVTECCSCGRVVEERQAQTHQLFALRAQDNPLCVVTNDLSFEALGLPALPQPSSPDEDEDPFLPTGFLTAFSTWSLEPSPLFTRSSSSFSGHLAELERALESTPSSTTTAAAVAPAAPTPVTDPSGPLVSVDHLRAYLQILDVSSILDLDHDIVDHAFQLFRDCSSTTCLRNRSVEALATAALVQAIREAQEPRTLQEISSAANLPQKEIGKYIKILGEALKLSQPINSNSISVHMPRFCTLLQLNKSAQELAAHIGEVVINKCFCTRRNPISISAAAIYLACQLEDKRKTQAEICKVTGLTEVTLRKVYKELLENWDDLLPPNYTPAVPPEKAFPMTSIPSSRASSLKVEAADTSPLPVQPDKSDTMKQTKASEITEPQQARGKDPENKSISRTAGASPFDPRVLNQATLWQTQVRSGGHSSRLDGEKDKEDQATSATENRVGSTNSDIKVESNSGGFLAGAQAPRSSSSYSNPWGSFPPRSVLSTPYARPSQQRADASTGLGGGTHSNRGSHVKSPDNSSR